MFPFLKQSLISFNYKHLASLQSRSSHADERPAERRPSLRLSVVSLKRQSCFGSSKAACGLLTRAAVKSLFWTLLPSF